MLWMLRGSFLFLALCLLSPCLWAASVNCLDEKRVQDEVLGPFEFVFQDKRESFDRCQSESLAWKVADAILFLKDASYGAISPAMDIGVVGRHPLEYLHARIDKIIFDESGQRRCRGTTTAYVLSDEERTMHICPYANLFDSFSMALRLVHESRHTDGFPHVLCEHGGMARYGSAGCDPNYTEYKGSYGVGVELAMGLASGENNNQAVRQQARAHVVEHLLERFNTLPLDMKEGALLQSQNQDVFFYDGEESNLLWPFSGSGIVTLRSSVAAFFNRDRGEALSSLFGGHWMPTPGEYGELFRDEFSPQKRFDLLDVHYGWDYSCLLFSGSIVCGAGGDPDQEFEIRGWNPVQFVGSTDSQILTSYALYVLDDAGLLHPLPRSWRDVREMDSSDFLRTQAVAHNIRGLGVWKGQNEIGVGLDGRVMIYSRDKNSWSTPKGLPPGRFEKVFSPYYWSPLLEEL